MKGSQQIFLVLAGNFRHPVARVCIFVLGDAVAASAGLGQGFAGFQVALQIGGLGIGSNKQASE